MSTGLAVFDTSVQETNEWLRAIEQRLRPCERQQAYTALRAVLHVLRDRLPTDAVLGLSAQVPMLMRGLCCSKAGGLPAVLRTSAIRSDSWRRSRISCRRVSRGSPMPRWKRYWPFYANA